MGLGGVIKIMTFRNILKVLIPAFLTSYFIREIFLRESWSLKVSAILVALFAASALVQNITVIKYGEEKENDGQISLSKTMGLIVFAFFILLFPQLIFVESHWLFKIPIFLMIIYGATDLVLYLKNK